MITAQAALHYGFLLPAHNCWHSSFRIYLTKPNRPPANPDYPMKATLIQIALAIVVMFGFSSCNTTGGCQRGTYTRTYYTSSEPEYAGTEGGYDNFHYVSTDPRARGSHSRRDYVRTAEPEFAPQPVPGAPERHGKGEVVEDGTRGVLYLHRGPDGKLDGKRKFVKGSHVEDTIDGDPVNVKEHKRMSRDQFQNVLNELGIKD